MVDNNDTAVTVTEENFGELLIEGLREARAIRDGEREPAHTTLRPVPPREDGARS